MRKREAIWLYEVLSGYPSKELSPCLNLGSSTKEFREKIEPHIHSLVLGPLEKRGVQVINFDLKCGEGVDISGDIFDDKAFQTLKNLQPRAILCNNIIEHVRDLKGFAIRCSEILKENGRIFITVPRSYPYHPDPIDKMFRPSPKEICELFPGLAEEKSEIILCTTYLKEFLNFPPREKVRKFVRLFTPFYKPKEWFSHVSRLLWLWKPYEISCVVLKKTLLGV